MARRFADPFGTLDALNAIRVGTLSAKLDPGAASLARSLGSVSEVSNAIRSLVVNPLTAMKQHSAATLVQQMSAASRIQVNPLTAMKQHSAATLVQQMFAASRIQDSVSRLTAAAAAATRVSSPLADLATATVDRGSLAPLWAFRQTAAAGSLATSIGRLDRSVSELASGPASLVAELQAGVRMLKAFAPVRDVMSAIAVASQATALAEEVEGDQSPTNSETAEADLREQLDLVRAQFENSAGDLRATLHGIVRQLTSLKESRLKQAVALVVVPLLINLLMSLVNPVVSFYVERALRNTDEGNRSAAELLKEREARRLREAIVAGASPPEALRHVRIAHRVAIVRVRPEKRAAISARLNAGHLVAVLEKRKGWLLVAFIHPETGSHAFGWTLTKYLMSPRP